MPIELSMRFDVSKNPPKDVKKKKNGRNSRVGSIMLPNDISLFTCMYHGMPNQGHKVSGESVESFTAIRKSTVLHQIFKLLLHLNYLALIVLGTSLHGFRLRE